MLSKYERVRRPSPDWLKNTGKSKCFFPCGMKREGYITSAAWNRIYARECVSPPGGGIEQVDSRTRRNTLTKALWGLNRLDLFRGLNAMELQEIAKIANKIRFSRGDVIADDDSENRDVYVLMEGNVEIVSLHGVPLYRIAPGETFGELALLSNLKRTARAISKDDSWVILLNIGHLEKLGEEYPDIYKKVSDNIIRSLGVKLARANKLIELLKSELAKALKGRS
jgi:hypothetical protein